MKRDSIGLGLTSFDESGNVSTTSPEYKDALSLDSVTDEDKIFLVEDIQTTNLNNRQNSKSDCPFLVDWNICQYALATFDYGKYLATIVNANSNIYTALNWSNDIEGTAKESFTATDEYDDPKFVERIVSLPTSTYLSVKNIIKMFNLNIVESGTATTVCSQRLIGRCNNNSDLQYTNTSGNQRTKIGGIAISNLLDNYPLSTDNRKEIDLGDLLQYGTTADGEVTQYTGLTSSDENYNTLVKTGKDLEDYIDEMIPKS